MCVKTAKMDTEINTEYSFYNTTITLKSFEFIIYNNKIINTLFFSIAPLINKLYSVFLYFCVLRVVIFTSKICDVFFNTPELFCAFSFFRYFCSQ